MIFFKNHFGMVVSMVIAVLLSFAMATTATVKLAITANMPFIIENWIRNWGTAFLVIVITTMVVPSKIWGDKLAGSFKLKPRSLPFGLVSNIVPTFFYNTFATMVLVGVNLPAGPNGVAGFGSSIYWVAVMGDWFLMFVVSYILSLFAEALAIKVAVNSCQMPPHGSQA